MCTMVNTFSMQKQKKKYLTFPTFWASFQDVYLIRWGFGKKPGNLEASFAFKHNIES